MAGPVRALWTRPTRCWTRCCCTALRMWAHPPRLSKRKSERLKAGGSGAHGASEATRDQGFTRPKACAAALHWSCSHMSSHMYPNCADLRHAPRACAQLPCIALAVT